ncbi:hypothetical protein ACVWYH_007208 [Bradyrhizobium sp. GM24.11]
MVGKASTDGGFEQNDKAGRALFMQMARDPSAAEAEEFDAARRKGTREAFELFSAP